MKRIFSLMLMSLMLTAALAQNTPIKARLNGRVIESESADAMPHATVQLLKPDTTSMVTGAITNNLGNYQLKDVAPGTYVMKISYIGYHNFYRQVVVKDTDREKNVGTAIMTPSSVMLQSAVVTATMSQVEVKDDTLVFNADAFKVPEGSVLEELVRKLPGAEVAEDGTITINGKTVKKIMVEGKEFFGNNRNMAMKNIPTHIVDKIKTYDRQSDMARMTGIDDGEEETVIDLTIKKGMKKGWFGNLDLAGGTKERHSEKGQLFRFQDNTQATLIGSYNNINDRTGGGGGRGRGGGGNGVTTSGMGGLNLALVRGKVEFGGNVNWSGSKTDAWSRSSSQNFVTTRTSFSNSFNSNKSRNSNVRGDFRFEWKPDSFTTLNIRPNFSFGENNSRGGGQNATFNHDPFAQRSSFITDPLRQIDLLPDSIKVNFNRSNNRSEGENNAFGGNLILNRRIGRTGRNVSLSMNGNYSENENRSFNLSDVAYFQYGDSVRLTYRYRTTPNWSKNFSAGFNYTEPIIARRLFFQTSYRMNYSKRHSDGQAYDMGGYLELADSIRNLGAGYLPWHYRDYLDEELSRYTDNENTVHNLDFQLRLVTQAINMNVGVAIEHQKQRMEYNYQSIDTIASRSFSRVTPTLNFRYQFNRRHYVRFTYRGSTTQPQITDLFAMTDNSNPLNIRLGNPNLKPSFTNNLTMEWNDYVQTTMQHFNASATFTNRLNNIESRTEYNEISGGRITQPVNINGDWSMGARFGITSPLFVDYFTVSANTSYNHNNNVSFLYQNMKTLKNVVKTNVWRQSLRFNLRRTYWDVGMYGNLSYNHTRSKLVAANNRDSYDFSYGVNSNWHTESGWGASTDFGVNSRRGYSSAAMNTNELIWNAQVSYRFLKGKKATVSLQAFDILDKRSNISRTINANYRSDTETNAIYSYWMAHFIYRYNMFGGRRGAQQRQMDY